MYVCQHCIGGEGGGDYAQIVPLKITIVVANDSLVIFWRVFTSVPTTFDLHCSYIETEQHICCAYTIINIYSVSRLDISEALDAFACFRGSTVDFLILKFGH